MGIEKCMRDTQQNTLENLAEGIAMRFIHDTLKLPFCGYKKRTDCYFQGSGYTDHNGTWMYPCFKTYKKNGEVM